MIKAILQLFLIIGLFLGSWIILSQINFIQYFHLKQNTGKLDEEKIGNIFWETIHSTENEIETDSVKIILNRIKNILCIANQIDTSKIKIHVIAKDEINAFAIPNNHLVIYSNLIEDCDNEAELAGVIAHEIAHMEHNHVMKKMIKETGLGVLVSVIGGNTSGTVIRNILHKLSSTAYDRSLESDADATAVQYTTNAHVNPEGLGNFLLRLSKHENDIPKQLFWLSTHPDSKERADFIFSKTKKIKFQSEEIINTAEWQLLKKSCKN